MLRRIVLFLSAAALLSACSDSSLAPSSHSSAQHPLLDLRAALTAQRRHTTALLKIPGVVGTAVTTLSDGRPGVLLLLERRGITGLPDALDGERKSTRLN